MNPASPRPDLALLSLVSPSDPQRPDSETPATSHSEFIRRGGLATSPNSRCRRSAAPPNDQSSVFSSTYKLFLLSKKRSPSNSTDYKLQGAIPPSSAEEWYFPSPNSTPLFARNALSASRTLLRERIVLSESLAPQSSRRLLANSLPPYLPISVPPSPLPSPSHPGATRDSNHSQG